MFFARAENEYLDVLVEGGALGLLAALAFVAAIGCLAYQAIRRASGQQQRDRGFAWGCVFGLIAVSVQSLADFAPHVPAIGVLAIALCGQLAALAQEGESSDDLRPSRWGGLLSRIGIFTTGSPGDRPSAQLSPPVAAPAPAPFPTPPGGLPRISRAGGILAWLGSIALAVVLLAHGLRDARVEKQLMSVSLPSPGAYLPTIGTNDGPSWDLEAWRNALESALRLRPNWAEGHVRLGLVHLGLYRLMAREWLRDAGAGRDESELWADPLQLLGASTLASQRALVLHTTQTSLSSSRSAAIWSPLRVLSSKRGVAPLSGHSHTASSPASITCSSAVIRPRSTRSAHSAWPGAMGRSLTS